MGTAFYQQHLFPFVGLKLPGHAVTSAASGVRKRGSGLGYQLGTDGDPQRRWLRVFYQTMQCGRVRLRFTIGGRLCTPVEVLFLLARQSSSHAAEDHLAAALADGANECFVMSVDQKRSIERIGRRPITFHGRTLSQVDNQGNHV
jgi:hypothetical protein